MKLLELYRPFAGTKTEFIKAFRDNDTLYNQAINFWNSLESVAGIILLIGLIIGIALTVYYYTTYNNHPGRHYKPRHWFLWMGISLLSVFLLTWGFEILAVKPKLDGASVLEAKIALGNAVYAVLYYLLVSWVWCMALPTNAYRFLTNGIRLVKF
jgi:membrane-associated HD superfamily phosphohydrolase